MRGREKKVIYVRDTKNPWFEEAYFVLRRGVSESPEEEEGEMVKEAERLLRERAQSYPKRRRGLGRTGVFSRRRGHLGAFFAGALSAGALFGAFGWFFLAF